MKTRLWLIVLLSACIIFDPSFAQGYGSAPRKGHKKHGSTTTTTTTLRTPVIDDSGDLQQNLLPADFGLSSTSGQFWWQQNGGAFSGAASDAISAGRFPRPTQHGTTGNSGESRIPGFFVPGAPGTTGQYGETNIQGNLNINPQSGCSGGLGSNCESRLPGRPENKPLIPGTPGTTGQYGETNIQGNPFIPQQGCSGGFGSNCAGGKPGTPGSTGYNPGTPGPPGTTGQYGETNIQGNPFIPQQGCSGGFGSNCAGGKPGTPGSTGYNPGTPGAPGTTGQYGETNIQGNPFIPQQGCSGGFGSNCAGGKPGTPGSTGYNPGTPGAPGTTGQYGETNIQGNPFIPQQGCSGGFGSNCAGGKPGTPGNTGYNPGTPGAPGTTGQYGETNIQGNPSIPQQGCSGGFGSNCAGGKPGTPGNTGYNPGTPGAPGTTGQYGETNIQGNPSIPQQGCSGGFGSNCAGGKPGTPGNTGYNPGKPGAPGTTGQYGETNIQGNPSIPQQGCSGGFGSNCAGGKPATPGNTGYHPGTPGAPGTTGQYGETNIQGNPFIPQQGCSGGFGSNCAGGKPGTPGSTGYNPGTPGAPGTTGQYGETNIQGNPFIPQQGCSGGFGSNCPGGKPGTPGSTGYNPGTPGAPGTTGQYGETNIQGNPFIPQQGCSGGFGSNCAGGKPGTPGSTGYNPGTPGAPGTTGQYGETNIQGNPFIPQQGCSGGFGSNCPGGKPGTPGNAGHNQGTIGLPGTTGQHSPGTCTNKQGFYCVSHHLCKNGKILLSGEGVIGERLQVRDCDLKTEICCQLEQQASPETDGSGIIHITTPAPGFINTPQFAPGLVHLSPSDRGGFVHKTPPSLLTSLTGNSPQGQATFKPIQQYNRPHQHDSAPNLQTGYNTDQTSPIIYPRPSNNYNLKQPEYTSNQITSQPNYSTIKPIISTIPGQSNSASTPNYVYGQQPLRPGDINVPISSMGQLNHPENIRGQYGTPIGGSIYDNNGVTLGPQKPYTGPLNTTPHPGCAAALKCVSISYCTAEGVMSDSPIILTREQEENRVPLSECADPDTGAIGKCCRDPNYKDPWPGGMMMPGTHPQTDGLAHSPDTYTCSHPAVCVQSYQCNGQNQIQPIKTCHIPHNGNSGVCCLQIASYTPSNQISSVKADIDSSKNSFTNYPTPSGKPLNIQNIHSAFPGSIGTSNIQIPTQTESTVFQPGPFNPGFSTSSIQKPSVTVTVPQQIDSQSGQPERPVNVNLNIPGTISVSTVPSKETGFLGAQYVTTESSNGLKNSFSPIRVINDQYKLTGVDNDKVSQPHSTITQEGGVSSFPSSTHVYSRISDKNCGIINSNLVKGQETAASDGEFPWQVVIFSDSRQKTLCSGVLISANSVITTAQCVKGFESSDLAVHVGVLNLRTSEPRHKVQVAALVKHPSFDSDTLFNDLAILVLQGYLPISEKVNPICLPSSIENIPAEQRDTCVASGWTKSALQGNAQINDSFLHKIRVNLVAPNSCEDLLRKTYLGKYFVLNKSFSCSVPINIEQEMCLVDSGAPISCPDPSSGQYILRGIYSWDVGCQSSATSPTVLGSIDVKWIETVLSQPAEELAKQEQKEIVRQQQLEEQQILIDTDKKPGFAQGYGK